MEALIKDDSRKVPYRVWTRVGYTGKNYYLVEHDNVQIKGLIVRVRKGA